jgi:hypothetical protein
LKRANEKLREKLWRTHRKVRRKQKQVDRARKARRIVVLFFVCVCVSLCRVPCAVCRFARLLLPGPRRDPHSFFL